MKLKENKTKNCKVNGFSLICKVSRGPLAVIIDGTLCIKLESCFLQLYSNLDGAVLVLVLVGINNLSCWESVRFREASLSLSPSVNIT